MANLRITWLGHGGILYRSPDDAWVWIDRWTGAPTYPDAYRSAEQVSVVAPTHGHFDHVGDDLADVVELAKPEGAVVLCSHEMSIYLAGRGVEAVGMNKGGTFEAAGIGFTMVHADHTGGATLTAAMARSLATSAAGAGSSSSRTAPPSITRATPTSSAT